MIDTSEKIKEEKSTQISQQESSSRATISDHVSPYLEPLYELIVDDFIKKYKIEVPLSFWFLFSLFVSSVVIIIFKIDLQAPLFFFSLAFLILLTRNRKLIAQRIFPKKSDIIDDFIKRINERTLDETRSFIQRNFRGLDTNSLILILKSKFNDNPSIYQSILSNQFIHNELMEYIISNNLILKMGRDIFCDYLVASINPISRSSYEHLIEEFKDDYQIIKTLNVCYPFYLRKHRIFKCLAGIRIRIRESFNYGHALGIISIISLLLVVSAIITPPHFVISYPTPTDTLSQILRYINLVMGILITTGIVTIIITIIIKWLLRRYRSFLYLIAPNTID